MLGRPRDILSKMRMFIGKDASARRMVGKFLVSGEALDSCEHHCNSVTTTHEAFEMSPAHFPQPLHNTGRRAWQ